MNMFVMLLETVKILKMMVAMNREVVKIRAK